MESNKSCRCCLLRPSGKDINTPHTSLGKTETYLEMLKDCFEIDLPTLTGDDWRGICEVCAARLRDASDFKVQVQRCQVELQRRKRDIWVKDELPLVKLEISDEEERIQTRIQLDVKLENSHASETNQIPKNESVTEVQAEQNAKTATKLMRKKLSVENEIVAWDETSLACLATPGDTPGHRHAGTCDSCGQQFTKKIHLIKHMKGHKKIKVYNCEVCNNNFKRYKQLVVHKRVHKGEKPFSCEICNKRFRETSSLDVHNRIHTGEKPFSCESCNKQFTQKRCLLSHKRTHATDAAKAYICTVCNKGFTQNGNLKAHIRVHTGEKPFQCQICKKQFNHQSSLNHHMRTHAGGKTGRNYKYSCKHCNRNFKSLFTFKCHERIHNGEKPYTCEECNKQFGRKDHLDRHKQLHTGVKQYCCEICGKQFTERSNLNAHVVVHSGLARRRRRPKRSWRDDKPPSPGDQAPPSSDQNSGKHVAAPPTETQSA